MSDDDQDEAVLGTGASGDPKNPGLTQQEIDETADEVAPTPAAPSPAPSPASSPVYTAPTPADPNA